MEENGSEKPFKASLKCNWQLSFMGTSCVLNKIASLVECYSNLNFFRTGISIFLKSTFVKSLTEPTWEILSRKYVMSSWLCHSQAEDQPECSPGEETWKCCFPQKSISCSICWGKKEFCCVCQCCWKYWTWSGSKVNNRSHYPMAAFTSDVFLCLAKSGG